MARLLKGAPVAAAIGEQLIQRTEYLKTYGVIPKLAILRVGERPDDVSYESGAAKRCGSIGIAVERFFLPSDCDQEKLLEMVRQINQDPSIHGCLMLRPLPNQRDEAAASALLAPEKDVDGMTAGSLNGIFTGNGTGYAPCTAQACIELLDYYGVELGGKNAVVVGRSLVIGKPVSMMLQARNATVTMCHTKTKDLAAVCQRADILVAAAGKAEMVDERFVRPGQVVVDVGINLDETGKLCGDVRFEAVEPVVAAITPVPGGVGSVTTAVLAKHVIEAAEKTP